MNGTKRAADAESGSQDAGEKKQKTDAFATALPHKRSLSEKYRQLMSLTDEQVRESYAEVEKIVQEVANTSRRSEKEILTDDLNAGTHELIFEYNNSKTADECLVMEQGHQYHEKIQGPYRINLNAKVPNQAHWSQLDKPNRRFFHVSSLEAVGVDIAKYIKKPAELIASRGRLGSFSIESSSFFHPAITHWMETQGKAFDADLYTEGEYGAQVKIYRKKLEDQLSKHMMDCTATLCKCPEPP